MPERRTGRPVHVPSPCGVGQRATQQIDHDAEPVTLVPGRGRAHSAQRQQGMAVAPIETGQRLCRIAHRATGRVDYPTVWYLTAPRRQSFQTTAWHHAGRRIEHERFIVVGPAGRPRAGWCRTSAEYHASEPPVAWRWSRRSRPSPPETPSVRSTRRCQSGWSAAAW
jgi:hypothetical protein